MPAFDLAVIGSGPGGYRAGVLAKLRGLSVAIIEKDVWGGCCLNRGCVPKKTWHHSAKIIAAAREFARRGIRGRLSADLTVSWQHQKQVVTTVRDSYMDYIKRLGIKSLQGAASFIDANTLSIDGASPISANHIIIATGSYPYAPSNLPLIPDKIITTDELFNLPPPAGKRVAIVGGGVIGAEFAFILKMLSKEVTWLTSAPPLQKTQFSQPALKLLNTALVRYEVSANIGRRPTHAETSGKGVTLHFVEGPPLEVDWVLLGTGRKPYSTGLNLDGIGITHDAEGFIAIDEFLQTSLTNVYAIGDVVNSAMTANQALADAKIAVTNMLKPATLKRDPLAVPELIYSALELGRVGLNENQAEDQGFEPAIGFASLATNPAALGEDDIEGFVRILADLDSGVFLGGEVIGAKAGEIIHLLAQAYGKKDALKNLSSFYNHPSRAEEVLNATETLAAKWGIQY